jgi:hypothetical protein
MKRFRLLSLILCVLVLGVNFHAVTAKAAPLSKSDSAKIARVIAANKTTKSSKGASVFINSFTVTNLDAPKNGNLLDRTATIIADNGFFWDVPVLWVNQKGELVNIAIQVDDVVKDYPIIAFYLPAGYNIMFSENAAFNINMPDFICNLINQNGVTTMTNPAAGITYITPLLPNQNKLVATKPADYQESGEEVTESDSGKVSNGDPENPAGKTGGKSSSGSSEYQYNYNPKLSDEEKKNLVAIHCQDSAVEKLGEDNLAWLVSFVKDVIEPEAVALLQEKFPAYKSAAKNSELGKDIGLYVYYESSDSSSTSKSDSDDNGSTEGNSQGTVAYVSWKTQTDSESNEFTFSYRLGINASYLYAYDEETGTYSFDNEKANSLLDCTVVHEMMHAFMDDYERTGMTGYQYSESTGYKLTNKDSVAFPNWFTEGMATAVDNAYQYWNNNFHNSYGYDKENDIYSASALKESYLGNSKMQLSYAENYDFNNPGGMDNSQSSYVSGYLANVYLGYLAAQKYDSKDAIKKDKNDAVKIISSSVILSGVNHILEELHKGKTLDDVIKEISTVDGTPLYSDTADFTKKFIASSDEAVTDNNASLEFCTNLLNYLEDASDEKGTANGSILVDFTSKQNTLLSKKLLKKGQTVYVPSDTKDFVKSTVDFEKALESGGESQTGIAKDTTTTEDTTDTSTKTDSDEVLDSSAEGSFDYTENESNMENGSDSEDSGKKNDEATGGNRQDNGNDSSAEEVSTDDENEKFETGDNSGSESPDASPEPAPAPQTPQNDEATGGNAVVAEEVPTDDSYCIPAEITYSEPEPEAPADEGDNSAEQQVLDAIPEDHSSDDDDA